MWTGKRWDIYGMGSTWNHTKRLYSRESEGLHKTRETGLVQR